MDNGFYDLFRDVLKSQSDVDVQIAKALNSLKNTSDLITHIEDSLRERSEKLEALRKEHERYSQLAQIDAKKAEALLSQIETTLGRNAKKERWIAFLINIIAGLILFVLGVVLSDSLKTWLAKIWDWL